MVALREVKVLHTADLHLDYPFSGLGVDGQVGRERRQELKQVAEGIVALARRERVDLLLIAGDLLEQRWTNKGTVKFVDDLFRTIPQVRVFIAPGNHDPLVAGSYYQTYRWAPNVHIFGPRWSAVDLPDLGCTVYGFGFDAYEISAFRPAGQRAAEPDRINIAVLHGSDVSNVPSGVEPYHPFTAADLSALGMDYVALGHYHAARPVSDGNRLLGRYSGSPEALGFGETGRHGVLLGGVAKGVSRLEFVPTGLREYISRDVDCSGAISPEDVMRALVECDDSNARQRNLYHIALKGVVDPELRIETAYLAERLRSDFYYLRLSDRTQPDYDLQRLLEERSARGLFVRRLLEREEEARDQQERDVVRRALYLGLAAFEGRRASR